MKKKLSALCALFGMPVLLFLLFLAIPQPAMAQTCQITINPLTGLPDCKTGAGSTGMTAPGSNGMVGWNGSATVARTITGGSGISITNGDGISGNPTVAADTTVVLSRATDQAGTDKSCASSDSAGTSYTCTLTPTLTGYTTNMVLYWTRTNGCTSGTSLQLNVDTLGAKSVYAADGSTVLTTAECGANRRLILIYDGTNFRAVGGTVNSSGGTTPYSQAIVNTTAAMTGSDVTVATFSNVPALAAGACYTLTVGLNSVGASWGSTLKVDGTAVMTINSSGNFGSDVSYHAEIKYCNTSGQTTQRLFVTRGGYGTGFPAAGAGITSYFGSNQVLAATNNIDWSTSHTVTITGNSSSGTFTVGLAELKQ